MELFDSAEYLKTLSLAMALVSSLAKTRETKDFLLILKLLKRNS